MKTMTQIQKKNTKKRRKPNYTKRAKRLQKELMLSIALIFLTLLICVKFQSSPNIYRVVVFEQNNEIKEIQYYNNFKTAKKQMQKQIENGAYNPAVLNEDGKILAIRYGIVNFRTKTCTENTSYEIERNGHSGYTNGCYGGDGAFLETDNDAKKVKFKQSGVIGWADIADIEIQNAFAPETASINHYTVKDNAILHHGTTNPKEAEYALMINIGDNDASLKAETTYYSYDAHYFYTTFQSMIDDYRNQTYENSINKDTPHYNYYQYLTHRAKTSYVSKDLNWYISTYLGYSSKPSSFPPNPSESQLYDEGYTFIETQNKYGINAIMMLSLAINESGFGRSQISIEKNNLFGHAAYDNAPNESANGYKDVASSIQTHAQIFLNNGYLNPCDQADSFSPSTCYNSENNRYKGGYFGDKDSGMNVFYASDPYWGEKAAKYYQDIDALLGEKDKTRYTIKVLNNQAKTPVYGMPDTSGKVIFYTPDVESYALVILDELEGGEVNGNTKWYKVQSDGMLNPSANALNQEPQIYAYKTDVVYIPAAYFENNDVK